MKRIFGISAAAILLAFTLTQATAQQKPATGYVLTPDPVAAAASASPTPPKPPTEITAVQDATFSQKTRTAVFNVDVRVKDPEYTITCDKLTAVLKKDALPGSSPAPRPSPSASDPKEASQEGSNLEKATAEGHVIIIQDKTDAKTGKVEHYVGKSQKAVYDGDTGDITLTGWPQIQQGPNTHVSLQESTVMVINRSGTIRTHGPSKTLLTEEPETPAKNQ